MDGSDSPLLLPEEVADLLRVDTKTVIRWADRGLIAAVRLPGGHHGHRRYRRDIIDAILGDTVEPLLTPDEVAKNLRVDIKTITRWAAGGQLACVRLPGGHRRYR